MTDKNIVFFDVHVCDTSAMDLLDSSKNLLEDGECCDFIEDFGVLE